MWRSGPRHWWASESLPWAIVEYGYTSSLLYLLTWLKGCRSRMMVDMMAASTVYLRCSAPTWTVSETGKASFLQFSLSFCDLNLKRGRLPLTVSSFKSLSFVRFLAASTRLWTLKYYDRRWLAMKSTTCRACPPCLERMWDAMPELEVSLGVQPTFPLLTIWSQWTHLTTRKSP